MNREQHISHISVGERASRDVVDSPGDDRETVPGIESIVVFGLMITAVADENPASVYSLHVDDTVTRAVREALGAGKIRLAVRKNLGDADVIHDVDDADDKLRS